MIGMCHQDAPRRPRYKRGDPACGSLGGETQREPRCPARAAYPIGSIEARQIRATYEQKLRASRGCLFRVELSNDLSLESGSLGKPWVRVVVRPDDLQGI